MIYAQDSTTNVSPSSTVGPANDTTPSSNSSAPDSSTRPPHQHRPGDRDGSDVTRPRTSTWVPQTTRTTRRVPEITTTA